MYNKKRLDKVIEYIGENIDLELSLEQLSKIACFSKYHFHRLFTIYTGVSLHQYIRWLRLKRAAHQLIIEKDIDIIKVANDAGFESNESFARVFKKMCGLSPSEFRIQSNWQVWERPPYCLDNTIGVDMKVDIKNIQRRRLAVLEHYGSPAGIANSVNKLIAWAKSQPMDLKPLPGEAFGFAYHDPKLIPEEDFRFDLAITIPNNLTIKGEVVEKILPEGRYATLKHKGSRANIDKAIYSFYREWLPKTQEELGDLPCIFCYYNFEHEVAETELLTECWFLLKD